MRAIAIFSFEQGTSTTVSPAWLAFRILVNISAMGSVIVIMRHSVNYYFKLPATNYQLALLTPGISPLSALSLKHIRHMPNLRRYALGLPQSGHLL